MERYSSGPAQIRAGPLFQVLLEVRYSGFCFEENRFELLSIWFSNCCKFLRSKKHKFEVKKTQIVLIVLGDFPNVVKGKAVILCCQERPSKIKPLLGNYTSKKDDDVKNVNCVLDIVFSCRGVLCEKMLARRVFLARAVFIL